MAGGLGLAPGRKAAVRGHPLDAGKTLKARMNLGGSVTPSATAAKLGDSFQYAIDRPVTLQRQKSALLPILGKDVQASRLSIYNEKVQARFPLLGLRLKNTTGLHLMQGPVTVYDGSTYAGDARVMDLQPGEERLVSYAVDLGTEVNAVPSTESGRILTGSRRSTASSQTRVKHRQAKAYTAKNRNDAERTLLVEHPVNNAFTLVGEKPRETASDVHRFELKLPAGATKTLTVTEEQEAAQLLVSSSGDEQVRWLISQPLAGPKLKAGLAKALELRGAKSKTTLELAELRRQLASILEDQTRMRANVKELPSNSRDPRQAAQEVRPAGDADREVPRGDQGAGGQEHAQDAALRDFLAHFSAE